MAKSTKTIPAAVQENQNKSQEPKGLEGFELESLRVSQDFVKDSGVKKLLTTVPVRKPNRQDFFRVHPESSYVLDTMLLNLKDALALTFRRGRLFTNPGNPLPEL